MKRKPGQRRTKSYVPWSAAEIRYLRLEWHELQQRTLHAGLTKLHPTGGCRTWCSIRVKAYQLGLPGGVPQGFESIKAAAKRTGYCRHALLALCLRYGVPIRQAYCGTRRNPHRFLAQCVATDDLDAMLAEHHQRRSIAAWAAQYGFHTATIYLRIKRAGGLAPIPDGFRKRFLKREEIEPFVYPLKRGASAAVIRELRASLQPSVKRAA